MLSHTAPHRTGRVYAIFGRRLTHRETHTQRSPGQVLNELLLSAVVVVVFFCLQSLSSNRQWRWWLCLFTLIAQVYTPESIAVVLLVAANLSLTHTHKQQKRKSYSVEPVRRKWPLHIEWRIWIYRTALAGTCLTITADCLCISANNLIVNRKNKKMELLFHGGIAEFIFIWCHFRQLIHGNASKCMHRCCCMCVQCALTTDKMHV